jgi:hypothetical protein
MKKLAKALRMAGYILILFIAAFAVGLTGHFLPITRERYQDKKVTTEQVDKKREEDEPEKT